MKEKYKKYCDMVREQSYIYDKTEHCNHGQTWKYHLEPVIDNAIMLGRKYGADLDVVALASIFHDYANLIDYNNSETHHILGGELTEKILTEDGCQPELITKIKKCIFNHRASIMKDKHSIEEICVADADALAHIDNVVELICWRAYQHVTIEEANAFVKKKITKSYNKMSEQSKILFKEKYENIMKILY